MATSRKSVQACAIKLFEIGYRQTAKGDKITARETTEAWRALRPSQHGAWRAVAKHHLACLAAVKIATLKKACR